MDLQGQMKRQGGPLDSSNQTLTCYKKKKAKKTELHLCSQQLQASLVVKEESPQDRELAFAKVVPPFHQKWLYYYGSTSN